MTNAVNMQQYNPNPRLTFAYAYIIGSVTIAMNTFFIFNNLLDARRDSLTTLLTFVVLLHLIYALLGYMCIKGARIGNHRFIRPLIEAKKLCLIISLISLFFTQSSLMFSSLTSCIQFALHFFIDLYCVVVLKSLHEYLKLKGIVEEHDLHRYVKAKAKQI